MTAVPDAQLAAQTCTVELGHAESQGLIDPSGMGEPGRGDGPEHRGRCQGRLA
jgi:hypothetical protein